ncbi:MAG TPA: glycosyltransferase [Longimicrobiales bacterium]|nr:glycosyltransferase [Longimicrobiales bacterium]
MQKRILIASASAGTGHVRAAESLRAAFAERAPDMYVEHVDVLEHAPAWVRSAYRDGFELLAARAPGVWREIYHLTDGPGPDTPFWGGAAYRLLFRAFDRVVRSRPWNVCICTHFLPAQLLAGRSGNPPFAMVITDFALHRFWAQPAVCRYFVATPRLAEQVRARVRGARVEATGIPVRPDLLEGPTRAEAVAALGLEPGRPVVLVMGGGLGLGVTGFALGAAGAVSGTQVVALCGRSERSRAALGGIPGVRAVGYVDDVRPYLAAADVIVTKPGGLSTSEALALGRPLVLASPIPGHEEENRRVLVAAGAALPADSPEQIAAAVRSLIGDVARREELSRAARRLGRPHAAQAVAAAIEYQHSGREAA